MTFTAAHHELVGNSPEKQTTRSEVGRLSIALERTSDYLEELSARLAWLAIIGFGLFVVVLLGYTYHQVVQSGHYRQLAENNRLRESRIQAGRGLITDRFGRTLVENVGNYQLLIDRSLATDLEASLTYASRQLNRDSSGLRAALARGRGKPDFVPVLLAEDLRLKEVAAFEVVALEHPEFLVSVEQRRLYRHGEQTAHLLGYLGEVSKGELADSSAFRAGDLVGKEGVEQSFDRWLRGSDGEELLVVDSRGRVIEQTIKSAAEPGQALQLTIDLDLQQEAYRLLGDRVGSVVVLDPENGALRAMVSRPSFDPNLFARRLRSDEWAGLVGDPHRPLQNRSIQNTYPPGSTFKVVVAAAALDHGIDPHKRVQCTGSARLYGARRRCWKSSGHGWTNMHEAIRESCDVYFYTIGQELGIDTIADYSRRFGLGSSSGVALAGERSGLVPDGQWSQAARGGPWYPGETISVAIGQGPLLVTPLQLAVMTAVIANGGSLVTPHWNPLEASPPLPLSFGEGTIDRVRLAMLAVVEEKGGSGVRAKTPGLLVSGKTGTAQVVAQKTWTKSETLAYEHRDHSWFISFAPYDDPELVIVVMVEHGDSGSRVSAPIAKALYEKYLSLRSARSS